MFVTSVNEVLSDSQMFGTTDRDDTKVESWPLGESVNDVATTKDWRRGVSNEGEQGPVRVSG